MTYVLESLIGGLLWLPPLVTVLAIAALAFLLKPVSSPWWRA